MRAADVLPGMLVDLEGDEYADVDCLTHDCGGACSWLDYELAEVVDVERETPDCVAIGFEGLGVIGFPPDHELRVA